MEGRGWKGQGKQYPRRTCITRSPLPMRNYSIIRWRARVGKYVCFLSFMI